MRSANFKLIDVPNKEINDAANAQDGLCNRYFVISVPIRKSYRY